MSCKLYLSLLALASGVLAQKCPLQFDGRVPKGSTVALFDTKTGPYNPDNVFGAGLTMSKVMQLPTVPSSLFDKGSTLAHEVTISDASIFNNQTGFRRAELLPLSNSGSDNSTVGIKTLHFSLMRDTARPMNLSHEYQLVFVETAAFDTNQFALKAGTISGREGADPNRLVLQSNVRNATDLHAVAFTEGVWHNYALTLDFTKNTTEVFYSQNAAPLVAVAAAIANDVSGRGQYHFGMLKKPTGTGLKDVTKEGFQEANLNEGVVYGGVFMEDSAAGCVSLSP